MKPATFSLLALLLVGCIAAAFYGVPDNLIEQAIRYLPDDMLEVIRKFDKITR